MRETIESLLPIERNLFFALNGSDSIFWDNMFWTMTGKVIWAPMLLFLAVMFFYRAPVRIAILTVVSVAIIFTLCDQISSSIFKDFFQRPRPTHHPDFMEFVDTVKGYRSRGYSFISGHATNSFGIAVFLSLVFRSKWMTIPLLVWALLNSYSRVYLGVHFITDILGGMVVGTIIAFAIYSLYCFVRKHISSMHSNSISSNYTYSLQTGRIIGIVIIAYISLIIIFSPILTTLGH